MMGFRLGLRLGPAKSGNILQGPVIFTSANGQSLAQSHLGGQNETLVQEGNAYAFPQGKADVGYSDPVPANSKLATQNAMTATGTSAQTAAFQGGTGLVCVQSDESIYVAFGSNPTATTNDYRIPAGGEQWFAVKSGWMGAIRT